MPERISKLQRWLDLIAYLVVRRMPVSVEELMESIPSYAAKWHAGDEKARASVRRMFERDKDDLRQAGIPIRTVAYSINYGLDQMHGYRLDRHDFYLPYLRLMRRASGSSAESRPRTQGIEIAEGDARTAVEALHVASSLPSFPLPAEAQSAFGKLMFDLEPASFGDGAPVLFVDRPGAAEERERLRVLAEALVARKRVHFVYHAMSHGETMEREVAPYGLLYQYGYWYLIGLAAQRGDVRIFRVGRMEAVTRNTKQKNSADYTIPADFTLDRYAGMQPWELGDPDDPPLRAEVRFRFPYSLWAERNGFGTQLSQDENGATTRGFDIKQVGPFLRWILSLEGEAEIKAPPELAAQLRAMAARIAEAHGAGAADA